MSVKYFIFLFLVVASFSQEASDYDYKRRSEVVQKELSEYEQSINYKKAMSEMDEHERAAYELLGKKKYGKNYVAYSDRLESLKYRLFSVVELLKVNNVRSEVLEKAQKVLDEFNRLFEAGEMSKKQERQFFMSADLLGKIQNAVVVGESYVTTEYELKRHLFMNEIREKADILDDNDINVSKKMLNDWKRAKVIDEKYEIVYFSSTLKELLKYANTQEALSLAKDLYGRGLEAFDNGNYSVSVLLLELMLNVYEPHLERAYLVKYFLGLSYAHLGEYNAAINMLEEVLNTEKGGQQLALTMLKMLLNQKQFSSVNELKEKFEALPGQTSDIRNEFYFILLRFYGERGQYLDAVSMGERISQGYYLYYDSRFLYASALYQSDPGKAKNVLQSLVNGGSDVPYDVKNDALVSLAYIYYEEKNYTQALSYLESVDRDNFYDISKLLLAQAWCYYKRSIDSSQERNRKTDFYRSSEILKKILRDYPETVFLGEVRVLLGRLKHKDGRTEDAIVDLSRVIEQQEYKMLSDRFSDERGGYIESYRDIDASINEALLNKDFGLLAKLDAIEYGISKKFIELNYRDFSNNSRSVETELKRIRDLVKGYERLRRKAFRQNKVDVVKIAELQLLRLYSIVLENTRTMDSSLFGVNYFKDHRLARIFSIHRKNITKYNKLFSESSTQLDIVNKKLKSLEEKYKKDVANNEITNLVAIKEFELKKSKRRIDYLNTQLGEYTPLEEDGYGFYRWMASGAYLLETIGDDKRDKLLQRESYDQYVVKGIDDLFQKRDLYISAKVKQVEEKIYSLTRQEKRRRRIQKNLEKESEVGILFLNKNVEGDDDEEIDILEGIDIDSIRTALESQGQNRLEQRMKAKKIGTLDTLDSLSVDSLEKNTGGTGGVVTPDRESSPSDISPSPKKSDDAVREENEKIDEDGNDG